MRLGGARWAVLGIVLTLGRPSAEAGYQWRVGANPVLWRAASPAGSWENATSTLKWAMSSSGHPDLNLEATLAQMGSAVESAFQSIEDVTGARIQVRRLPDSAGPMVVNDGRLTVEFHTGPGDHDVVGDLTGILGIVWPETDASGTIMSMDVVLNAENFRWSTANSSSSFDIETTVVHEVMHTVGLGHTPYFYAGVFQLARGPEQELHDRCYSPLDRNFVRLAYPQGSPVAALTGRVTRNGTNVVNAVVVATDADGIPQVAGFTDASGNYSLPVPPGSGYSVTATHVWGIGYQPELPGSPTNFIDCTTATASAPSSGVDLSATDAPSSAAPQMQLRRIDSRFQVAHLAKGYTGPLSLTIFQRNRTRFTAADVQAVDLGPGIAATVVNFSAASLGTDPVTVLNLDVSVNANAKAGPRNLSLTKGGERLMVAGAIHVLDAGGLAISGALPTRTVSPGAADVPVLRFDLTATAVEDVRVRSLLFDVAGDGPPCPEVRLWRDANGDDVFQPGSDERIFTSAAYQNAPVDETISYSGAPGSILLRPLCIPVLAGTTETFFLTFEFPASGSGSYTVSLASTGFTDQAHGMFYGDVIVPTGSADGGTVFLDVVGVSDLAQHENVGGTPVLGVGSPTAQPSVVLRGFVVGQTGNLRMDVEVKPVGTPFDGTVTASSAATAMSGLTHSITVAGLSNQTSYHWRGRARTDAFPDPGPWLSFGDNPDGVTDFSVDDSATTISLPAQHALDGSPLPVGGASERLVSLRATVVNSAGVSSRLEVEVMPAGSPFTGVPTQVSAFGPSGAVAAVGVAGPATGDYRWQARAVNAFGVASAWTDFGPPGTSADFRLVVIDDVEASAGCAGRASGAGVPGPLILGLMLFAAAGRRRRGAIAALVVLAGAGSALAQERAVDPPVTLSASLGVEFLDLEFDALGTDLRQRDLDGMGLPTLALEATIALGENLHLGAGAEAAFWDDTRILSAGPLLAWRFASGGAEPGGPPATEHRLKAGALFRQLEVSKSGFGDFDPAIGFRAGYEFRWRLGPSLGLTLSADARWSVFDFDEDLIRGDDEAGGLGVLISVGLAWNP